MVISGRHSILLLLAASLLVVAVTAKSARADESSKSAAAEALLEVMRVEAMMDQMYAQIPQMIGGFMPQGPDAPPPEDMQVLLERIVAFLDERIGYEVMKPDYIALYADSYSEEDMLALTDFMDSPLGQRFLDATPELMIRTSVLVQERMQQTMPDLLEFMEAEVQAMKESQ